MELNQARSTQRARPTNGGAAREPSEIQKQEKTTRTRRQEDMADSTPQSRFKCRAHEEVSSPCPNGGDLGMVYFEDIYIWQLRLVHQHSA